MVGPTSDALQVFYGTIPAVGAILLTQRNSNKRLNDMGKRIDDLKTSINKRIDDLASTTAAGFAQVNTRLDKLALLDRSVIPVDQKAYESFVALLDTPPNPNGRLLKSLQTPAVWD